MKKHRLAGQQIKFVINMVALAIFAFSYFYLYTGYVQKTDAAYDEIAIINKKIQLVEAQTEEEDAVLLNTQEVNGQIQAIIDGYPVDITRVDNLLFVEKMEKELNISFTSVNTTDSSPFFTTILPIRNADGTEQTASNTAVTETASTDTGSATPATDATASDGSTESLDEVEAIANEDSSAAPTADQAVTAEVTTMTGAQSTITMNFITTYEGFQELVDYINYNPDKTVIDSVTVSKDNTTGLLSGSLVLKRYALAGTGKVYEAPVIDDISIGTDNIFGSDAAAEEIPAVTEIPSDTQQVTP